ncbi:GNAT family N-acetyltransferase, partial [bacterium]|nr:GNAT family N-acetyltransferase [bacterium]
MGLAALRSAVTRGALRSWRFAYFAAMRGARGDVTRSARRLSPLRAFRPLAELLLYFEPGEKLARLSLDGAPAPPPHGGLDLSPAFAAGDETPLVTTDGRKDFVLASSGKPWPLVHLPCGPSRWKPTLAAYLRRSGEALVARAGESVACFAIDRRLADHADWLALAGFAPGAVCTVYALSCPPWQGKPAWVHLATSEI